MGESSIGWLHPPPNAGRAPFGTLGQPGYTVNFWIGCTKVDPECANCYAEREAERGRLPTFREQNRLHLPVWGPKAPRHIVTQATLRMVDRFNREAEAENYPRWIFGGSQMDWLEDRPDLVEPRARLLAAMERTRWLRWIMLTKRPENFARLVPQWAGSVPDNVWIGISAGSQESLDSKLEAFAAIPSTRKMISGEPLLERVDWRAALRIPFVRWIIFGGESGPRGKVRANHLSWMRDGVDQARAAGVAPFVKQLGAKVLGAPSCVGCEDEMHEDDICGTCGDTVELALVNTATGKLVRGAGDGRTYPEGEGAPMPGTGYERVVHLKHCKGEDWREWPPDLLVQEWPDGAGYTRPGAP